MQFTVIMPAYNARRYIAQAIASVVRQPFSDWELLIINDGSTDETRQICEKQKLQDARITLINQTNAGVSAARNTGIRLARGEYLFFLDADDRLGNDAMQQVQEHLERLDYCPAVVFGNYTDIHCTSSRQTEHRFRFPDALTSCEGLAVWKVLFEGKQRFVSPIMAQVYKTAFIRQNKLFFDPAYQIGEDHDWRWRLLSYSDRYTYLAENLYFYRCDYAGSVTHSPRSFAVYEDGNKLCTAWYQRACHDARLICVRRQILHLIGEYYTSCAIEIASIQDADEKLRAIALLQKHAFLLKYARQPRYKAAYHIYRGLGVNAYLCFITNGHALKQMLGFTSRQTEIGG